MSTISHIHRIRVLHLLAIAALIATLLGAASAANQALAALTPVITWNVPAPIVYGTPLSASQLNATANVPGTFRYTPAAGMVLNAGSPTLKVAFTPDDTVNYDSVDKPVQITVNQANLVLKANNAVKVYGAALPTFTVVASGLVNDDTLESLDTPPSFTTNASASSDVGTYAITPQNANDPNYTITFAPGTLTIIKAPLTIIADDKTKQVGSLNPTLTASYAGFVNDDDETKLIPPVAFDTTAADASPVDSYPITPKDAVNPNSAITFVPGTLTVTSKQVPQITWANPAAINLCMRSLRSCRTLVRAERHEHSSLSPNRSGIPVLRSDRYHDHDGDDPLIVRVLKWVRRWCSQHRQSPNTRPESGSADRDMAILIVRKPDCGYATKQHQNNEQWQKDTDTSLHTLWRLLAPMLGLLQCRRSSRMSACTSISAC